MHPYEGVFTFWAFSLLHVNKNEVYLALVFWFLFEKKKNALKPVLCYRGMVFCFVNRRSTLMYLKKT